MTARNFWKMSLSKWEEMTSIGSIALVGIIYEVGRGRAEKGLMLVDESCGEIGNSHQLRVRTRETLLVQGQEKAYSYLGKYSTAVRVP